MSPTVVQILVGSHVANGGKVKLVVKLLGGGGSTSCGHLVEIESRRNCSWLKLAGQGGIDVRVPNRAKVCRARNLIVISWRTLLSSQSLYLFPIAPDQGS
jgi:hypothetical protein